MVTYIMGVDVGTTGTKCAIFDTEGNVICNADMKISIVFLSNKTQLTLATVGDKNSSFLQQYFTDNGIRLKVIEIL